MKRKISLRKHKRFFLKIFSIMVYLISVMTLLAGCSKEQFWGVAQISRPGSSNLAADVFVAQENKEVITPEQARKYLENSIAKVLDASSYNIKVSGKLDWKKQDQAIKVFEYENKILLDRNEKCFRQDWLIKNAVSKDKPLKGSSVGKKGNLYFDNGSGKWEQGNPQLFMVVFSNIDSVIKHLNSIRVNGTKNVDQTQSNFLSIENTYYEKNQIVIEGSMAMDTENASASRGLFSVADVELSALKVESFSGKIKVRINPKDGLIVREDISGSYIIGGEECPLNIMVEIDKINETIDLKLPSNVMDSAK